jgi:uncharacterized protein (TIGR03083 family)
VDLAQCCDLVAIEIDRLADVTDGVDPTTPVPSCDGWTVADLLQHTGEVFRWAATMVRDRSTERLRRERMDWTEPASPDGWPAWIRDGRDFVVDTLRASDPTTPMWAWGTPKTAAFWPRRMVHEVGVHRADAELAVGLAPAFDPSVAADGVAELLDNIPHAEYFAPNVTKLRGDGQSIGLRALDIGAQWQIHLLPDRFVWVRNDTYAADENDCEVVVTAPSAGDLLLTLYGRPATGTVEGDEALWRHWQANAAI